MSDFWCYLSLILGQLLYGSGVNWHDWAWHRVTGNCSGIDPCTGFGPVLGQSEAEPIFQSDWVGMHRVMVVYSGAWMYIWFFPPSWPSLLSVLVISTSSENVTITWHRLNILWFIMQVVMVWDGSSPVTPLPTILPPFFCSPLSCLPLTGSG